MDTKVSVLNIRGVELEKESPIPLFRARRYNAGGGHDDTLTEADAALMGYESAFRILPYTMQDRYDRKKKPLSLKTAVLENKYIKATVLCDYGAKVSSIIDKKTGKDILFCNPVMQPGNLAIRNAWTSGGIEWNIGQLGHTFTTCEPLFMAQMKDKNGESFLRAFEFERQKGLYWMLDFMLPEDSELLYVYVRIVNPADKPSPMYWWTNVAVPETEKTRVFSNTDRVLCSKPGVGWTIGHLPVIPSLPEEDVSYSHRFPFANEYFFQIPEEERMPWEAVVQEDGTMYTEASTSKLRFRKMFCWGNRQGGQHWQDYLAEPGKGNYIEAQGGLAPTQGHGLIMPENTVWDFVQAFGATSAPEGSYKEWHEAQAEVSEAVHKKINIDTLYAMLDKGRAQAHIKPEHFIHPGSGWGALEEKRLEKEGKHTPEGFYFPEATIGKKQLPWYELLETGRFPQAAPDDIPVSWMTSPEWTEIMKANIDKNQHAFALMNYGCMLYENGRDDEAREMWNKSIELQPSQWAYRNLASAANMEGKQDEALEYMNKAYAVSGSFCDMGLYVEYFQLLSAKGYYEQIWQAFESMPGEFKKYDRIQLLVARAALETDRLDYLTPLFEKEFAVIQEGELTTVDIWYKYSAKLIAKKENIPFTPELIERAKKECPPPRLVDYRMN